MASRGLPSIAAGLLTMLGMPVAAVAAPDAAAPGDVEAIFEEGRHRYDQGDFVGAARAWTDVLDRLEESEANAVARRSMLLNVLRAYSDAFQRVRDELGHRDIEHLRAAKRVADDYVARFAATYGERALAPEVQEAIDALDRDIEEAERNPDDIVEPCLAPCLSPPPPLPTQKGCGDKGDPGMALLALPLLAIGRRRRDMLERLAERLPADVVARLQRNANDDDDDA